MKLNKIFSIIVAGLAFAATSCENDYEVTSLGNIKVSQNFVAISPAGASVTVDITTDEAWKFEAQKAFEDYVLDANGDRVKDENDKYIKENKIAPSWLTLSVSEGKGNGKVTITVPAAEYGREADLHIICGTKTQHILVRQGEMTATQATCKEVIDGADGKTYIVEGICTSISNTNYGNWYLQDETGEIYIYGTVNSTGKYDWASFGIEVGDKVKVSGPKTTYGTTIELVDAKVLKVTKSLLKAIATEITCTNVAQELSAKFVVKGNGITFSVPDSVKSWASITSFDKIKAVDSEDPDTTVVKISVLANENKDPRSGVITFNSSSSAGSSDQTVKIIQYGPQFVCTKVTSLENGGKYILVGPEGAAILKAGAAYGYLNNAEVAVDGDKATVYTETPICVAEGSDADGWKFIFEGKTLYQTGTHNSFNWAETVKEADAQGALWKITWNTDGTAKVLNVAKSKWIQYDSNYHSWGSYNSEKGTLPVIYKYVPEN